MSILTGAKKNVLFVDDEEAIVNSLKLLFRRQKKFNVITTTNQQEALDIVDQNEIHVVVSDMRMPGMSGAELLLHVKEKSPNTMRILLTGYAEMENIIKSINTGEVYRFLEKPWSNSDLKTKITEAVDISSTLWESEQQGTGEKTLSELSSNNTTGSLLFVGDNESNILEKITSHFEQVEIHSANNLQKAVSLLAKNDDILTIIVQATTYYHSTVSLLKILKAEFPMLVSIVIANDKDSKLAMQLVNEAQVFRYLTEPMEKEKLYRHVQQALQYSATLRISPVLVKRHAVEEISEEEKTKILDIIGISFLANIGKRFSNLFGR